MIYSRDTPFWSETLDIWHSDRQTNSWQYAFCVHGWEIAVILRNFRKTKLSKSKFFFFFFFFNSISTYIQCATGRLSLCDIHKYRFPAFYGTSDRQAAIFFCTCMIQTWSSFSLVDPCSIFFCFSVKPKFFTPTHVCAVGSEADHHVAPAASLRKQGRGKPESDRRTQEGAPATTSGRDAGTTCCWLCAQQSQVHAQQHTDCWHTWRTSVLPGPERWVTLWY